MDETKPIRVFLEVVKHRSFTAAARSLRMTPASITRLVAKLESDFGQQLLLRTTRQVSLTSQGAVVAARYGPIFEELDRVTKDMLRANRPDRGRLKINAPVSMGMRMLPELIEGFRLAYPQIDLQLHLTDVLIDIIEDECDLAIRISAPPTDKSTIWRKLCEVPRFCIAAPSLFERLEVPQTPDDLDARHCLSYSVSGQPETWHFRKGQVQRTVRAGTQVMANNGDVLLELARQGSGIGVLPDFFVHRDLESGQLIRVLPEWSLPSLWLTLFYPPYEQLPPLVATFTDYFEAYLQDMEGLVFD
ncbi:MAG: LysR family transcriptional regulator [Pseudomonadota bacterium]